MAGAVHVANGRAAQNESIDFARIEALPKGVRAVVQTRVLDQAVLDDQAAPAVVGQDAPHGIVDTGPPDGQAERL